MTHCLEFRRRIGAEPFAAEPALAAHAADCEACARFRHEMRAMDELLGRALAIDLGTGKAALAPAVATPSRAAPRAAGPRPWLALAASLVLGIAVASTLWVSYAEPSLAAEVMDHVMHEPDAWQSTGPLNAQAVAAVLAPEGVRLDPGLGTVTYALRCRFAGRWVPHLLVRTDAGPVTVMLLTHRSVDRPTRLAEHDYTGVVLPAPRGSIAVVGPAGVGTDLDAVAQQVFEAVEWES